MNMDNIQNPLNIEYCKVTYSLFKKIICSKDLYCLYGFFIGIILTAAIFLIAINKKNTKKVNSANLV